MNRSLWLASAVALLASWTGCSQSATPDDKKVALDRASLQQAPPPAGTWTHLAATWSPDANIMLMTDGTLIGFDQNAGTYRFAPSAAGAYEASTWTALTSMHNPRLYFGSHVLPDGRVFVVGGEYGTGKGLGEIYDPVANSWSTPFTATGVADTETALLPDGNIYIAWISKIYDMTTNALVTGPTYPSGKFDEAGFVLLPDQSFLTIPMDLTQAYRYVPAQSQFVAAGTLPASLFDSGSEIGPGIRLASGKVLWIGANGKSAIYTPPANAADPGSWVAGPVIPNSDMADDAPAAVLPNGHVLFVADKGKFTGPGAVYEYDPTANSFSASAGAPAPATSFQCRMVVLPTGQVLLSTGSDGYLYTAGVSPDPTWKPTISAVADKGAGVWELSGTQLHGFSEGAAYGDDAEMSSNYPLVRFESAAASTVTYAKTFGWAPAVVGLGTTIRKTQFKLPTLPDGQYGLVVVANGIASDPLTVTVAGGTLIVDDFALGQPAAVTVQQAGMATTMMTTMKVTGFAEPLALTATALPTGITVAFNPASVTSDNGSSTLTISAAATAALGAAKFTVQAAGSMKTRTQDVSINVVPPPDMALPPPDMTVPRDLATPPDPAATADLAQPAGSDDLAGSGGNGVQPGHGGCSCEVGGHGDLGAGWLVIALGLFALALRPRRARLR